MRSHITFSVGPLFTSHTQLLDALSLPDQRGNQRHLRRRVHAVQQIVLRGLRRSKRQEAEREDTHDAAHQLDQRPAEHRKPGARVNDSRHHAMKSASEISAGTLFSGLSALSCGSSTRLWTYSPSQESAMKAAIWGIDRAWRVEDAAGAVVMVPVPFPSIYPMSRSHLRQEEMVHVDRAEWYSRRAPR